MKSVMISIRPKWCELIASGKKTVEVRKTVPKIETPFKCYIYQTVNGRINSVDVLENNLGKVIGEFVCDFIELITFSKSKKGLEFEDYVSEMLTKEALFTLQEAFDYSKGKPLYGWHISDLKIYAKPRELSEFIRLRKTKFGMEPVAIKRPPQLWCYVE